MLPSCKPITDHNNTPSTIFLIANQSQSIEKTHISSHSISARSYIHAIYPTLHPSHARKKGKPPPDFSNPPHIESSNEVSSDSIDTIFQLAFHFHTLHKYHPSHLQITTPPLHPVAAPPALAVPAERDSDTRALHKPDSLHTLRMDPPPQRQDHRHHQQHLAVVGIFAAVVEVVVGCRMVEIVVVGGSDHCCDRYCSDRRGGRRGNCWSFGSGFCPPGESC